jgi:hypothetical protein
MNRSKIDNSLIVNYESNYPLIPNENTYFKQEKMVCINSGDRNVIKYPQSNSFEIFLPTDVVNVASIQLENWMFPLEIQPFSYQRNNLQLEFTVEQLLIEEQLQENTFDPLGCTGYVVEEEYVDIVNNVISEPFIITINQGFYTDNELANEIQNKMNIAVNNAIIAYVLQYNLQPQTPYNFFKIIVSPVEKKFWFVNTLNPFRFTDSELYKTNNLVGEVFNPCSVDKMFTSYSYYGLPAYLGFKTVPAISSISLNKYDLTVMSNMYQTLPEPSFQQVIVGDQFINVNFIKPLNKYSLTKDMYIYLDIETLNGGDETKPFSNNEFTKTTNQGNGSVNSFLGRIPLFTTSSYATSNGGSDKQSTTYFNPPLERLRKLKINLRYHDGTLVDFGLKEWDLSLIVTSYLPSQNKKITKTPF